MACEYSGIVRDAFAGLGHDAWSCDLLPSESSGNHSQGDINELLNSSERWDLIIAHPPCTALCVAGNRFYAGTTDREMALEWTVNLWDSCTKVADRACLENPVGVLSSAWKKPDQYIQPWQYGHGETKKTGLWLHGLPTLVPTNIVEGRKPRIHYMSPGPDRGKQRSRFYAGIAQAMADQWGDN